MFVQKHQAGSCVVVVDRGTGNTGRRHPQLLLSLLPQPYLHQTSSCCLLHALNLVELVLLANVFRDDLCAATDMNLKHQPTLP